ncbi:MAG TPA: VWA domain-containing protein [Polyangiaceae bacterium]|nr:VWA domain-containing protein [Polyangiaceae bacterium]
MRISSCFSLASCSLVGAIALLGCSGKVPETTTFAGGSSGANLTGGVASGGASSPGAGNGGAAGSSVPPATGGSVISVPVNNAGASGDDKCTSTNSTATPLPPVLAFLIDMSGSMNERPGGAAQGPTKWVSTEQSLELAFTDMADGTGVGLLYYPNVASTFPGGVGTENCIDRQVAVPIAPLDTTQRQAIVTSLQGMTRPAGRTPTHDAYVFALQTVEASTLPGSKFVVLVTDGAPTFSLGCMGDGMAEVDGSPIVEEAARALARGVKTFVIGSPGSESARGALSQMATQGGTALAGCSDAGPMYCHFDMTSAPDFSAALNAAFRAITGQVIGCNYPIPPSPAGSAEIDLNKVNVNYTSGAGSTMLVPRDASLTDCNHGWQFSADQKQILLCPDLCDLVKKDNGAKVEVAFGCKTIAR